MLDYSKVFGKDIRFEKNKKGNIYKEFAYYSLEKGKYLQSRDYLSNDIIQLKILNEKRETIFYSGININHNKLNNYNGAYNIIQDLIQYMKEKNKKFVFFEKGFWENYYSYVIKDEKEDIKIRY